MSASGKTDQRWNGKRCQETASYGASGGPGYFVVRGTADPSGRVWEPPVRIAHSPGVGGAWDTCGDTEMVALDDCTALLVYTDFNYPDADGVPRKSILVRRIQVAVSAPKRAKGKPRKGAGSFSVAKSEPVPSPV